MAGYQLFIGTSGWYYDHWKKCFYPPDLPKNKWLEHYLKYFRTVEVNATFYRSFKPKTYHNWADKVPDGFRYVLKVPRLITHRKFLKNCKKDIGQFERSANILGEKLGLLLLQLAPQTGLELDLLSSALDAFKDPSKVAVEIRNKEWLTDETTVLIKEHGAIFVNIDSPDIRLLDQVTSETVYLRLHGSKKWYQHNYSDDELHMFATQIREYIKAGAKQIFVFFNNDYHGYAPENARKLAEIMD